MSKTDVFMEFLVEEGFRPALDDDGDIIFKFEGYNHYLITNEDDEMYVHFLRNGIWSIESAEELQRALMYANDVTRDTKVAKVYVNNDHTYASSSVELFFADMEQCKPCFMRALNVLQRATNMFSDKMRASIESA